MNHPHSEMWLIRERTIELTVNGKNFRLEPGSVGRLVCERNVPPGWPISTLMLLPEERSFPVFNDVLKLSVSGRYDKNKNFKGKFTPRVTTPSPNRTVLFQSKGMRVSPGNSNYI